MFRGARTRVRLWPKWPKKRICFGPVRRPKGPAPRGLEDSAQGFNRLKPWAESHSPFRAELDWR
jgi:hypothetical protein